MWDAFIAEHTVKPSTQPGMSVENPYCVRYTVDGQVLARQGAMVAYRGDLAIRTKGQGVRKLVKRAVTGEGVGLMEVEGRGEIWFADNAKNVFVIDGSAFTTASEKNPTLTILALAWRATDYMAGEIQRGNI